MPGLFYVAAVVAVLATVLALSRANVLHGLLYLVVSLLAVALVFFAVGAHFVAALEAIVYAGAIIVLFVFVVMMLGLAPPGRSGWTWPAPAAWLGPATLAGVLVAELLGLFARHQFLPPAGGAMAAHSVGAALYGPYLIGVELASMLLLGALVGAHHLGRRRRPEEEGGRDGRDPDAARPDVGRDTVRAGAGRAAAPAQPDGRPGGP